MGDIQAEFLCSLENFESKGKMQQAEQRIDSISFSNFDYASPHKFLKRFSVYYKNLKLQNRFDVRKKCKDKLQGRLSSSTCVVDEDENICSG